MLRDKGSSAIARAISEGIVNKPEVVRRPFKTREFSITHSCALDYLCLFCIQRKVFPLFSFFPTSSYLMSFRVVFKNRDDDDRRRRYLFLFFVTFFLTTLSIDLTLNLFLKIFFRNDSFSSSTFFFFSFFLSPSYLSLA